MTSLDRSVLTSCIIYVHVGLDPNKNVLGEKKITILKEYYITRTYWHTEDFYQTIVSEK